MTDIMDLIDAYAEARHRCGCAAYNAQTAEARQRVTDYIESIGAGGMQSLRAPGVVALADVLRKLDNTLGPGNVATTALSRHFSTGTSVEQAPAAINSGVEIIIDFSQVGTAGPFPVVDGRVSLPDATMLDLVHMLRPTYEAQAQQAVPKAAPGELHDHQILAITTAYEQGVGKGRQAHESGKEIANPYGTGYRCDLAWQYGYEEGKKQAERIAEAAPQQEAQEPAVAPCISDAYERIDRFLRNNLGDEDYADFSHDLELLCTAQPTPQPAPDCHHRPPCDECAALAAQGGNK